MSIEAQASPVAAIPDSDSKGEIESKGHQRVVRLKRAEGQREQSRESERKNCLRLGSTRVHDGCLQQCEAPLSFQSCLLILESLFCNERMSGSTAIVCQTQIDSESQASTKNGNDRRKKRERRRAKRRVKKEDGEKMMKEELEGMIKRKGSEEASHQNNEESREEPRLNLTK